MIHVWGTLRPASVVEQPPQEPVCGAKKRGGELISAMELRRRVFASGRRAVEPTICPDCYRIVNPTRRVER